jgi:hypothetical protein
MNKTMSSIRPTQAVDITTANSPTFLVLDRVSDGVLYRIPDGVSDEVSDGKFHCEFIL